MSDTGSGEETGMSRETNPRNLSDAAVLILLKENHCPMCLGELDTGRECNSCNFDAMPLMDKIMVKIFHKDSEVIHRAPTETK